MEEDVKRTMEEIGPENSLTEKVFFSPGDIVMIKQEVENKPKMVVKSIRKASVKHNKVVLLGIACFWFDKEGRYQEALFNTKDLVIIEGTTKRE